MTMRYKVVLVRSEEGVSVSVPGLPGCKRPVYPSDVMGERVPPAGEGGDYGAWMVVAGRQCSGRSSSMRLCGHPAASLGRTSVR